MASNILRTMGRKIWEALEAFHHKLTCLVWDEPTSSMQAIDMFRQNPCSCFYGYGLDTYVWPSQESFMLMDDIYIRSGRFAIGYIQGISVNCLSQIATIQHFALERDCARRVGLGRVMAYAIFLILLSRYGVRKIIFSEISNKYLESNYPEFFKSLHAIPVEVPMQNRPDWHWAP